MLGFVARYYSSLLHLLTAPFRAFWRGVAYFLPDQDVTAISSGGNLNYYNQSTSYRFFRLMFKIGLIIWAGWSTYVFVYHRPMLERRTRQLGDARAQHSQHMSDLKAFYKTYSDLHKEIISIDDQLSSAKTQKDEDELHRLRLNTWAQIEMISTRLSNMFNNDDYAPEFAKFSDLSVEYELTREENAQLRTQNRNLEEAMQIIADANSQIVERVSKLAADNADFLTGNMSKIRGSLTSLGLSEKSIAAKALRVSNSIVGSAIMPMSFDTDADPKYKELAEKIELWQGLARARSMLPIGAPVRNVRITSNYGPREHPIDGEPKFHHGIDFAGAIGTPLLAVAPGKVTFTGDRHGYGKTVEIDHGLGFTTLYAHLSRISIERGDMVTARQVVGLAGSTGRSTAPHLHYEIRYDGKPFNPYNFVKGEQ
ncbi:MAG: peptidoglycan DD-metalloendopeptidase family protein [Alphaproteobacteria bacterium]|nr:peptidoglycan DD-metalloendopeptidase family protein [Alphaproteobacteria bacterium]